MDLRCPRKLKKYPDTPCLEGKKSVASIRKGKAPNCPWFVSDGEYCYCFFKFMQDDGRAVPTHRIARMLMIDDSEVKRVVQSFRRRVPILFDSEDTEDIF